MKKFQLTKIGVLAALLPSLIVVAGCSSVFAPKDSTTGYKRGSSSSSTIEDQQNLDEYEKLQKAEAHRNMGNAYLRSGRHNMALNEFKAALRLIPDDVDTMYDIGLVYLLWNNPEEAIPYFDDVLKLRPNYAAAINSMGNAYLALKDYDRAIEYFDKINDKMLYATPYMPMTNKGLAYFYKGDYAMAEQSYKAALKVEPDYVNALVLLGQVQTETGNTKDALKALQKALRLDSSPIVQYYLGVAYAKDGDRKNAIKAFETVLREAPIDSEVYEQSAIGLRNLQAPVATPED